MKFIGEGETAGEAIENALRKHCLFRDEVKAEVIYKGRKGFLGFFRKPAKIKLEVIQLTPEEKAALVVKKIIGGLGYEAIVDTKKNGNRIFLNITSKDASRLIGKRGETLFALEHIINKSLSARKEESISVEVDIDSYRRKRYSTLKRMAKNAVEKAKKSGKPSFLPHLPSWERLVVYNYLRNIAGIDAKSKGKGENKKIAVYPANARQSKGKEKKSA